VQVVQGTAVLVLLLNLVAVWKQEPRDRERARAPADPTPFGLAWRAFASHGRTTRFLLAVGLGTAAFNMQDIILEPYGAEVLGLSVGQTTLLTGLMAAGAIGACALAARMLARQADPQRVAALGLVAGLAAFSCVVFAEPLQSATLFRVGVVLIGLGGGLFSVGTLSAAMQLESGGLHGMVLGAWGGVVATATGLSVALGGVLRDGGTHLAMSGALGEALATPAAGYGFVYHLELALLFVTLVVIGPLVRRRAPLATRTDHLPPPRFGLADFPG
jgi:BCD family chlorophyll transporter-like MFS transporter